MEVLYYADKFVPIDSPAVLFQDRGYMYGDGVYEVVRVYGGEPFMLAAHMERFERSAAALRIPPPPRSRIESIVEEGLRLSGLAEAQIYLQLSRAVAPRALPFPDAPPVMSMHVRPVHTPPEETYRTGIEILLRPDERWARCWIKTLNLLPNVLARQEAMEAGCDEAILVHEGLVTEGSSSNIFAVAGGVLHTPPATGRVLAGVVRMAMIELAVELGIETREESFTPDFLATAEEAFITSTTIELLPVRRATGLAEGAMGACPGPVALALRDAYRVRCRTSRPGLPK